MLCYLLGFYYIGPRNLNARKDKGKSISIEDDNEIEDIVEDVEEEEEDREIPGNEDDLSDVDLGNDEIPLIVV